MPTPSRGHGTRRQRGVRFERVRGGRLSFDGDVLCLVYSQDREVMVLTDYQIAAVKHVTGENRISQCSGYDFFLVVD